jgi:thiol-disulfide isomerase/thioredoxin
MRSAFKLIVLISLSLSVAWAQGIEFFEGSWDEVLAEAKKERRLVFVDAYTTWCGPCKLMARNTFTDAEVGSFHNQNFVNYKFDMEKGEGPQFAAKYGVRAYPTIFWINYKGEVVHKAVGYRAPAQLLMESKQANSSENNAANLELGYKKGELAGKDLLDHALRLKAEDKPYDEAAKDFFSQLSNKELRSEQGWMAIKELSTNVFGTEMQYLIKKRKKFRKMYGIQVNQKIDEVFRTSALKAAYEKGETTFARLLDETDKLKDKGRMANRIKLTYAEAQRDWSNYATAAVDFYTNYPTTNKEDLKRLLETFVEHVDRKELLNAADDWGRQLTALENTYSNNALHARLLNKAENYRAAYTAANKAIAIAQDNEEDYEEMQELVDQLRSKL